MVYEYGKYNHSHSVEYCPHTQIHTTAHAHAHTYTPFVFTLTLVGGNLKQNIFPYY